MDWAGSGTKELDIGLGLINSRGLSRPKYRFEDGLLTSSAL